MTKTVSRKEKFKQLVADLRPIVLRNRVPIVGIDHLGKEFHSYRIDSVFSNPDEEVTRKKPICTVCGNEAGSAPCKEWKGLVKPLAHQQAKPV